MVTVNSRRLPRLSDCRPESMGLLFDPSLRSAFHAAGSRRANYGFSTSRDRSGQIASVQIGRWRVLNSTEHRRLAEVRGLDGGRVAVRVERFAAAGGRAASEIWQIYDPSGRLDAALQTSGDGRLAVMTDYRSRQAWRLHRNGSREYVTVESWSI
ncbi:MAG: hypothetical protein DCC67_11630 [Planctomycetota bacterium]|nr:MAG: hypothetical protein DCC67_11630 [Planctomycetota bacterium]